MDQKPRRPTFTDEEALQFHQRGKPGKLEITPTKPMATQRDLSLAYSPGVAVPVRRIAENPDTAYDYTAKGNLVAVISNGTAILGLGDLGALASKPVMEGKAVLFKRFADVDSIDLEVDTKDVDQFINAVRYLGPILRRHQSRGHQGARLLHHRAAPARADGHSRLPRRPARHRHHRHRRPHQCAASDQARSQDREDRLQRCGRCGNCLRRAHQVAGRSQRQCHPRRFEGRGLQGPQRRHEPVEVRPCGGNQGALAGRCDGRCGCVLRPLGRRRADARNGEEHGAQSRSSSPWPIRIRKSCRRMS